MKKKTKPKCSICNAGDFHTKECPRSQRPIKDVLTNDALPIPTQEKK